MSKKTMILLIIIDIIVITISTFDLIVNEPHWSNYVINLASAISLVCIIFEIKNK